MELVIASSNTHKISHLREILHQLFPHIQILSLFDFPHYSLPIDDETKTAAEQAKIKALDAAKALKKPCLAEQWRLFIPSLGENQKILFAKQSGNYSQQVVCETKAILEALTTFKTDLERAAWLESVIAVATPTGTVKEATGRTEGTIAEQERGDVSFDFDSLFIKHDYSKTLAELPSTTKARISHRRKALEKLAPFLDSHALSH